MAKHNSLLAMRYTVVAAAEQLPSKHLAYKEARIRAPIGNAADILIASSLGDIANVSQRYSLPPGAVDTIKISSLDSIWVWGVVGDFLDILSAEAKE